MTTSRSLLLPLLVALALVNPACHVGGEDSSSTARPRGRITFPPRDPAPSSGQRAIVPRPRSGARPGLALEEPTS